MDIHKMHTRADWSRRPLADEQLHYAADDVIYLAQAYQLIREKLQEAGRLDWLADDLRALSDPALYAAHPENAWLRVKGANRLSGAALAILQGEDVPKTITLGTRLFTQENVAEGGQPIR